MLLPRFNSQSGFACRQAGFTLIELVTVIGVLGVLATGLIVVMNPATQTARARDAKRKTDLETIQKALELYYDDHQQYPDSATFNTYFGTALFAPYMTYVPDDAVTSQHYQYKQTNADTYYLYAHLEVSSDTQACKNSSGATITCANSTGLVCGGTDGLQCDYGISSSNVSP